MDSFKKKREEFEKQREKHYNEVIKKLTQKKVLKEVRHVIEKSYPQEDMGRIIRQEIKDLIEQNPGFVKIIIKEAFIEYLEKYQIREIVDMYLIKDVKK